jgi:methionyl-tRNA formyltransferase
LKIVYLGTTEFAVTVLRHLVESSRRPALVVTPPDRPQGRGRRLASPPAARAAAELGLELAQTESVNNPEAVARVRSVEPEVGVVCAFGQLIKDPLLFELPMLNVHPSPLPRWRGAAPIERAIMAGDAETGVTIARVTAGLDSGPIALQEPLEIGEREDFGALSSRLAGLAGELIVRALELLAASELEFTEQNETDACYAAKIDPVERRLDPAEPADALERRVRALNPHIGAYLELEDGGRLAVGAARAERGDVERGRLVGDGGALRLGCSEGVLRLEVVQPPGKRPMTADAYLRGHQIPALERD